MTSLRFALSKAFADNSYSTSKQKANAAEIKERRFSFQIFDFQEAITPLWPLPCMIVDISSGSKYKLTRLKFIFWILA